MLFFNIFKNVFPQLLPIFRRDSILQKWKTKKIYIKSKIMEFYLKETYQIALEIAFKTWVWHCSC